jgi:hypothetical protein
MRIKHGFYRGIFYEIHNIKLTHHVKINGYDSSDYY